MTILGIALVTLLLHASDLVPCPPPARPPLTRNTDGSYTREQIIAIQTVACFASRTWREVWTARPEDGGHFVRDVGDDESSGMEKGRDH